MSPLCRVTIDIVYVHSSQTVAALTWVSLRFLYPSLLRNVGNKPQNNSLVSAETFRQSSPGITLSMQIAYTDYDTSK